MKNYKQDGDVFEHTAAADITSGQVVVMGTVAGVAITDIAKDEVGAVQVCGVFELAKATGTGTGIEQGEAVFWKASTNKVTADEADAPLGTAFLAANTSAKVIDVKLAG